MPAQSGGSKGQRLQKQKDIFRVLITYPPVLFAFMDMLRANVFL